MFGITGGSLAKLFYMDVLPCPYAENLGYFYITYSQGFCEFQSHFRKILGGFQEIL